MIKCLAVSSNAARARTEAFCPARPWRPMLFSVPLFVIASAISIMCRASTLRSCASSTLSTSFTIAFRAASIPRTSAISIMSFVLVRVASTWVCLRTSLRLVPSVARVYSVLPLASFFGMMMARFIPGMPFIEMALILFVSLRMFLRVSLLGLTTYLLCSLWNGATALIFLSASSVFTLSSFIDCSLNITDTAFLSKSSRTSAIFSSVMSSIPAAMFFTFFSS